MSLILRPAVTVTANDSDPVRIEAGSATLDALAVPYAVADIDVPSTFRGPLEGIDPRDDIRVVINAADLAGGTSRTFDLGVRERTVDHVAKTIRISLASDEALLIDWVALVEDATALGLQGSLRGIVDHVLAVTVGASLEAGGPDVPMPALVDAQNLIRNPRVRDNTTDWAATWSSGGMTTGRNASGGPAYAPTYFWVRADSASTGAYFYLNEAAVSVSPLTRYRLSATVRAAGPQSVALDAWIMDGSSTIIQAVTPKPVVPGGQWTRLDVEFWTASTAVKIRPRITVAGTMPAGTYLDLTAWRLSVATADPGDVGYFDGDTPDTAQYEFSWSQGNGNTPSSRRVLIPAATPDAFVWGVGTSAWDFLQPLVTVAGMRLFCDERRVWRLIDPGAYAVPGFVTVAGFNATSGSDTISREDSEVFATGVVVRYRWRDANGNEQVAYDVAGTPNKVVIVEYAQPFPGPGAAAAILARRNGTGRTQAVTAAIRWDATPGMEASISLPATPEQQGKVQAIVFSLGDDALMDITTRGLIDVPAGSWLGTDPDEAWTDPPDISWNDWT